MIRKIFNTGKIIKFIIEAESPRIRKLRMPLQQTAEDMTEILESTWPRYDKRATFKPQYSGLYEIFKY